ncbi:MAG: transketolase family protein [Anaerolineae bacterium]|nr:transketolase family protein [Anaerolineae bacterium]
MPTSETSIMGKPNQDIFSDTLVSLAHENPNIIAVTSDSRGSGKLTSFAREFPRQLVEVGIAEQNLVGIAAGLAAMGKSVFAVSPACFLTARALEQIKNDVAYSNHPVILIGISAGVSYGALGATHHAIHDFAVLQAIHNIDILAPADNFETEQAVRTAVTRNRPLYMRIGKKSMPHLHPPGTPFNIGKAIQLTPVQEQYDVAIVATGETVAPAAMASRHLAAQGYSSCVLSLHSIRPFDEAEVMHAAHASRVVITVEEHSINGGLGSRTVAALMQGRIWKPVKMLAIPDQHIITGSQQDIFEEYGLNAEGITRHAVTLLEQGREKVQ